MPKAMLRHSRHPSRLIAVGLAIASAVAAGAGGDLAGMRVTGVVMVPGESGLAVIEFRNGEQRFLRAGDQLPGIGSIAEVLPTGIRLQTPKGPRLVNLEWDAGGGAPASGGAPPMAAASTAAQQEGHHRSNVIVATPEAMESISRVAATPGAGVAEWSQALIPLLDLPADARVSPRGPATTVGASLAQGQIVPLQVEAGGTRRNVYIRPGQPAGGAAAGAAAR